MSKKAFDILPPYPEEKREYHKESPSKKAKKKRKSLFLKLIVAFILVVLMYLFIKSESTTSNNPNVIPSKSNFELFDNSGSSSLTSSNNPISVRILNGSSKTNNAATVKDALLKAGYQIENTLPAESDYAQSIIYYRAGNEVQAQKVASDLKGIISAQVSLSNTLESGFDIQIIVGNN